MAPCAAGAKETVIVQLRFGCSEPTVLQVLLPDREKSAGVPILGLIVTEEIASAWFPVFVSLRLGSVEVLPTLTLPKESEVWERLTTGAVPVPLKEMVCGLPAALSAMLTEAKREPLACGMKSAAMLQDAAGAIPVPPRVQVVCAVS